MSFNELNSVERYIVSKLSGVNLNAPDPTSLIVKEDWATYGSFRRQFRSALLLAESSGVLAWDRGALLTALHRSLSYVGPTQKTE